MAIDQFTGTASGVFGNVFGWVLFALGIIVMMGGVLAVAFWIKYQRSFNILVEIRSERATPPRGAEEDENDYISRINKMIGNASYKIIYDSGALKYDRKDKNWYFRLKKERVDLPTPPFNVLQPSNKGNVLKIWQKSHEEYVYLLPDKIDTENIITPEGKLFKIGQLSTTQVDGDIAYWNVKKKDRMKKLFDTESFLAKLIPYIPSIISGALSLMLIWIVFDKLPPLIEQLTKLASTLNSATTGTITQVSGFFLPLVGGF